MRALFSSTFGQPFFPFLVLERGELTVIRYEIRYELVQHHSIAFALLDIPDDLRERGYEFRMLRRVRVACCGVAEGDCEVVQGGCGWEGHCGLRCRKKRWVDGETNKPSETRHS